MFQDDVYDRVRDEMAQGRSPHPADVSYVLDSLNKRLSKVEKSVKGKSTAAPAPAESDAPAPAESDLTPPRKRAPRKAR